MNCEKETEHRSDSKTCPAFINYKASLFKKLMAPFGFLKLVQINLNNCRAAMSNIIGYTIQNSIDIVLVQDPYTRDGRVIGFPGAWNSHFSSNLSAGILIINNKLQATMTLKTKNVVIVNILMDELVNSGDQRKKFFCDITIYSPLRKLKGGCE